MALSRGAAISPHAEKKNAQPGGHACDLTPLPPPRRWQAVLCGLVHAVLMAAAFPPFGLWPTVFLAPIPLLWLAVRATKVNQAATLASLGVLPLWLFEMSYVIPISSAGYLPLTLYLSCFTWVFVVAMSLIIRGWPRAPFTLAFPVVWIGVEVLRGDVVLDGLPWFSLAHPLIDTPILSNPARLVGASGVAFLVASVVGGIASVLVRRSHAREKRETFWCLVVLLVWVAGSVLGGQVAPPLGDGQPIRVAIVQTNLPQNNKTNWTFEQRLTFMSRLEELTKQAASGGTLGEKPDFIVWPETMFPGLYLDVESLRAQEKAGLHHELLRSDGTTEKILVNVFASRLFELQRSINIPMVVGAIGADDPKVVEANGGVMLQARHRYNSAFIVSHGWVEPERFDKVALTPFGEYMPLIGRWPWLQSQLLALGARGMSFDLASGTRFSPLNLDLGKGKPQIRFATPICFEVTRDEHCRKLVFEGSQRRANLLINLTNDGWFGFFKAGRLQHLQLARWRCLELGTPMARAANTGVSALIDTRGRVIASGIDGHPSAAHVDGVLSGLIPNIIEDTPYARFGDWMSYPVLAIAGILTAVALLKDRRRSKARAVGA